MKDARIRMAALAASAVVVALLAASVAFNSFIGWKVESDAVNDIEYLLSLNDDAVSTGRAPNYFLVDSSFRIVPSERQWATEDEKALAAWFAEHPETGVVKRVTIGSWTCYAAMESASEYATDYDASYVDAYSYYDDPASRQVRYEADARKSGYYIAYVDIASEQALIASVNTAFVIIGIIGALCAAAAGYWAGKRIDEAHEAQKRFYENMSHDLKTPLAAIRGYAEGASSGVVDADEAARAISRETDRMTEAINEILDLSRLESGAVQLEKEMLEVGDFVQDCLMPLEGVVRSKGVCVQLDLAAGAVEADPGLFDHALTNVLANAVRHASANVRVTYDGAHLSVWNDGGAPDADQLPYLFDRFHAGEGGSTGVGLAIAKEVATLHGWDIAARVIDGGLDVSFKF